MLSVSILKFKNHYSSVGSSCLVSTVFSSNTVHTEKQINNHKVVAERWLLQEEEDLVENKVVENWPEELREGAAFTLSKNGQSWVWRRPQERVASRVRTRTWASCGWDTSRPDSRFRRGWPARTLSQCKRRSN